ncbi:hypothetical protein LDENG_00270450 [Lucifuga dentata]|nr:hypothetical protein LDENG_00270450 [Lucifuga dentata]
MTTDFWSISQNSLFLGEKGNFVSCKYLDFVVASLCKPNSVSAFISIFRYSWFYLLICIICELSGCCAIKYLFYNPLFVNSYH